MEKKRKKEHCVYIKKYALFKDKLYTIYLGQFCIHLINTCIYGIYLKNKQ